MIKIHSQSTSIQVLSSALDPAVTKAGHFVQLARDFGYKLEFEDDRPKRYRKLPQTAIEVRDNAVAYMKLEGHIRSDHTQV